MRRPVIDENLKRSTGGNRYKEIDCTVPLSGSGSRLRAGRESGSHADTGTSRI